MIIRAIPKEVTRGQASVVPLLSLYAPPSGGGRPLLAEMIERSGLSPEAFVRSKIIRPFARQYIELAVGRGIVPEPHAQNVLLELGRDGQPTGSFVHRDFGGFNIDFSHRRASGLALPAQMPAINSLQADYKIGRYGSAKKMLGRNLDSFFYGGFVYNLDKELPTWGSKGYLRGAAPRQGVFKAMLVQELEQQYHALTGRRVNLRGDLKRVGKMVAGRAALNPTAPRRPGLFRRMLDGWRQRRATRRRR